LLLSGANNYTGTTTISGGSVVASDNTSLGATNGGTTVASGATLELSGGITSAENITITGSGVGNGGAIRSLGDGENTLTGTITLGGNARINADSPIGNAIPLVSLGSSGFTVDTESGFTTATFSQGVSSLSLTNATEGQTLFGSLVSIADWVAYQYFGFDMALTGTNPNIGFAIEFMDSDFATLAVYNGTTAGITSSGGVSLLDLVSGGEDLSAVGALYFTWAGSETNFVATISNIVSVPVSNFEITGAIQGGNNVVTFGAAGPTAQGVGGNLTVSGIISGAGNTATNAATVTSLIKDGAGILTLSGANTYTGDTRIEAGTVTVASGGTLGSGSDVLLSGTSVLRLLNNVTVGSFQGTTNTTVFINAGQRLTMNGANKGAVVQAGRITGDGGLTLAGSGNTLLQLTGDNDFSGTTVVSGGVLELAATGAAAGALHRTTEVTVGSGATLLISDSDQINNAASITLSGGTIRRGNGVSETMGRLTLTGPSTLDFGSGTGQGSLAFAGSYTGNGHKLTINNFDFGSTLSFQSNLTSSISNTSLFEFVNGGFSSTSWNGTTFTITAIPEPSTYVAALGLLGLMLVSQRRSLRRWIA
jgi:autotransporter-associated beta strand protein